ncbi:hypothetical protein D9M70_398710 [compost metagenome]
MRSGNRRCPASAALRAALSVTPACTVMVSLMVSMSSTRFMRLRLTTTAVPLSSGTAPPISEVLPPCGTTGTRLAWHHCSTRLTCSVEDGSTTTCAWPR